MSRRHVGSLEPDDEVMPYSDDETDDELDASTEEEEEEPPGALQPPAEPQVSGETHLYSNDGIHFLLWPWCLTNMLVRRLHLCYSEEENLFFRDGMESESQWPALSPSTRVSEKSLPVYKEKQIFGKMTSV